MKEKNNDLSYENVGFPCNFNVGFTRLKVKQENLGLFTSLLFGTYIISTLIIILKGFHMTDNQKFIAGLLLGAVSGAAIALFLKSNKGKQIITDVKEGTDMVQDEVKTKLKDFDAAVDNLLEKGKQFMDDFESKHPNSNTASTN